MRTINRLSSAKITKAKPGPNGRSVLLCDGGGLWLQVGLGKGGQITKSWLFRYAVAGTKISRTGREYRRERQMGLGPLHTIGLAEARERAAHARLLLSRGLDPSKKKTHHARNLGRRLIGG
jgi:hypothetical protein